MPVHGVGGGPGQRGVPCPGGGVWSQGGAWSGGVCSQGVLVRGGCLVGVPGGDPLWTATAVGSTHPTGMHSCLG